MQYLALLLCLLFVVACGGKSPTTPSTTPPPQTNNPPPPPAVTLQSVSLSGNFTGARAAGDTFQTTATGTMSNGSTQNVTSSCTDWQSDNQFVATVNGSGLITARNSGQSTITTTCQGVFARGLITLTLGPRTSFGSGQYLVGSDIASGRYFSAPASSCYWERQSGLGGSLGEIIANEFVGFNAGQWIVDILSSDRGFETNSGCGTWNTSLRGGLQADIRPGVWLVGSQIAPGRYRTQASSGCYWERVRNFQGTLSAVIDNEFVGSAGQQIVDIRSSDAGFHNDADCGTWTRISSLADATNEERPESSPSQIEANWQQRRRGR